MTSETLHDPSPTSSFTPVHLATLQHIASTDEFLADTPIASGSESSRYDWPSLRDAIKHRIRVCLDSFDSERPLDLHPATALVGYMMEGEDVEGVWGRADAGLLCRTSDGKTPPLTDATETTGAGEEDSTQYRYRSTTTLPEGTNHPPFVHRADIQNFYPSKRPSSTTTVVPLTPDQAAAQTRTLFAMLDEFDVQPPFTIQRLCELLVSPTAHYRHALKWARAVQRCLSVTATRDAFPISPVQAPVGAVAVNGHAEHAAPVSEGELDRMDGLPPAARSRSASVGSVGAEPLFSPIPFVVRAEGVGAEEEAIPDLELGGADRTTAPEGVAKEVLAPAPVSSEREATEATQPEGEGEGEDERMSGASATASTAPASEGSVAAAVNAVPTPAPGPALAVTSGPSEPLGVPAGQVDEVDNPTHTVNALTSTTTTPAEDATGSLVPSAEEADRDGAEEQAEERSTKRRKSVASIHDA